jgi:hypothetical protein
MPAEASDLPDRLEGSGSGVTVVNDDVGPFCGQLDGDAATNAVARACNDGDLAGKKSARWCH